MAKGDKPVAKLYGKKKQNGSERLPEYIDIAAFWNGERGLSGQWSRDIVKLRIKQRDGSVIDLSGEELQQYFCNFRDDRQQAPATRPAQRAQSNPQGPPVDAPPDFGDDDIPF